MIGLLEPMVLLRRARVAACIAGAWASISSLLLDAGTLTVLGDAGISLIAQMWLHRLVDGEASRIHQQTRSRLFSIAVLPRRESLFYLGIGFHWQRHHAQQLWDRAAAQQAGMGLMLPSRGDAGIFAVGEEECRDFYHPEADNNQHVGIFGGPGFGKSRLAELYIVQAVQSAAALIIIDPKGDPGLRQRAHSAALALGRTFRLFDLTSPHDSATYNPLSRFSDPAQLGSRYAALCPPTAGERFWTERAAATGQLVATAMDAVRTYLLALGARDGLPPPCLRAFCEVSIAVPDPGMRPTSTRFLVDFWTPRLTAGDQFGVDRPHQLLAGMLLVLHAHDPTGRGIDPERMTRADVPELWALHQDLLAHHPFVDCADDTGKSSACVSRAAAVYAVAPADRTVVRSACARMVAAAIAIHDICEQGIEYWQKINCSLPAALIRFRGARERIVCASDPDIVWPRVYAQREVVYFSLGAMVDRQASEGLARVIVEDLAAQVGMRNASAEPALPVYFLVDEIASFITPTYVDLLNKSRSSGMRCIMIGQTVSDIEATLGSRAKAEQVLGNLNTLIQLRTPSYLDATRFAQRSGTFRLLDSSANLGVSVSRGDGHTWLPFSSSDSRGFLYRDREQIPATAIANLPVGQAFVLGMGFTALIAFPIIAESAAMPSSTARQANDPCAHSRRWWRLVFALLTTVAALWVVSSGR